MTAPGVADIIDLEIFPWGNAYHNLSTFPSPYYDKSQCFVWVKACAPGAPNPPADCYTAPILCQHGDRECQGNSYEMCVVDAYPGLPALRFIYCLEIEHNLDLTAVATCAAEVGLDYNTINTCMTGPRLAQLTLTFAQQTASLGVGKLGVPWVIINGQVLQVLPIVFNCPPPRNIYAHLWLHCLTTFYPFLNCSRVTECAYI
jgi:hypothetical protein